jgi:hypothetical protein
LKARGQDGSKTSVQRWYLDERRIMAGTWQARRDDPMAKIDALTFASWEGTFGRRKK